MLLHCPQAGLWSRSYVVPAAATSQTNFLRLTFDASLSPVGINSTTVYYINFRQAAQNYEQVSEPPICQYHC